MAKLSLLVWPDAPADFTVVDREPDTPAYEALRALFERAESTPGLDWPGAQQDVDPDTGTPDGPAYLRFTPDAAAVFRDWLQQETTALRRGDLPAALESHFIKYRKTVCALALLFHIAANHGAHPEDGPPDTAVALPALLRALNWIDYLKAHAQRIYGAQVNTTAQTAQKILAKIKAGELAGRFKGRELKQHRWEGLNDSAAVDAALAMLVEFGWVREVEVGPVEGAGRRTVEYLTHPQVFSPEG